MLEIHPFSTEPWLWEEEYPLPAGTCEDDFPFSELYNIPNN